MKPLLLGAIVACTILVTAAEKLPETAAPTPEGGEEPQNRNERCTNCGLKLGFGSPNEVLAQIQAQPGVEFHSQSSFEGCSSDKGCAGLKVKDGKVLERFGDVEAFKAAAASDANNEFTFHAAGSNVFNGGIPKGGPYWWMNENSPFKNVPAGGNYEKFSSSSSSFSSSGDGAALSGSLDLSGNPFLNGDISKLSGGFPKPGSGSGSSYSSFEQSSYSNKAGGEVDIAKNPFFNGALNKAGQQGFQAQFGSKGGYQGSSPSPFTAPNSFNGGANVNLIQGGQKSEFDFEQSSSSSSGGSVGAIHHDHGGDLQQTCAGQGYVCVHKAQCNNGVVNTNGAGILQARTKKQYCNTKNEICCRIEVAGVPGNSGAGLQGSLGVGSATFSGQGGLFATNTGFGASGSDSTFSSGNSESSFNANRNSGNSGSFGSNGFNNRNSGSSFGATGSSGTFESGNTNFGASGTASFGNSGNSGSSGSSANSGNFGGTSTSFESTNSESSFSSSGNNFDADNSGTNFVANRNSGTNFNANRNSGTNFNANRNSGTFSGTTGFGSNSGSFGTSGQGTQGSGFNGNRGVNSFESSSSTFESSGTVSNGFNGNGFGTTLNGFGSTQSPGGLVVIPPTNGVTYKGNTQTNFIETDSFSSGSDSTNVYRPGAVGLKPGIPYLPPAEASNTVSSTVFPVVTTRAPRPTTARPTYLPPSTSAPGYLPPVGEQSINTETRVPPNPTYDEGSLILDQTRTPRPKPPAPIGPIEIPSGCAAALKCTPIEYCTAEGVISNTTIILTKDQETYRVPLTDCKDIESGRIGKCCRDPFYTDPWPVNQLGKWVPGAFGGNDGKYTPDSRGSPNNPRPAVTSRPPSTGSTILNNFITPRPTPAYSQTSGQYGKGQYEIRGQGQYQQNGIGQFGQGQVGQIAQTGQRGTQLTQDSQFQSSQNQFTQSNRFGQGQIGQFGIGQGQSVGQGQIEIQEGAQYQGQSQYQAQSQKGIGQAIIKGQGQAVSQGFGQGVRQGQGFSVSGGSFGVENEYSASSQRVSLQQYNAGAQCGVFNGQKPYGNRNELEVDFAEIPWQAMVLLQTNKSLLCGGVITRPEVVITSAACVDGLEAKNVLIKGGEWKLGIDEEPLPFQIVQVKHILRHPEYKRGSLHNDVAILVLAENLRWAKNIYPICLPGASETLDAYYNGAGECIVTGWGKQVLQAHLAGSIMHSLNISLINPGECQAKLSQDYPHLLEQYEQNSCACGQPLNPINNICKVDVGSALACTTGDGHYVLRGIYSWDSGCQPGNQLAAFYKFDLEWYEWALGLSQVGRFAQLTGQQVVGQGQAGQAQFGGQFGGQNQFSGQIKNVKGQGHFGSQFNQFSSKFSESQSSEGGLVLGGQIKSPVSNSFSASYAEKKVYQSEPKIITYTTKPEYFTFTTKPKLVTYTTKPQIITYETSGSGQNPQYVAPGVPYNPFAKHVHNPQCKCLESKK